MPATTFSLDHSTPGITAIDPRGLVIRNVAYCRTIAGGKAQPRVTRQRYNHAAQQVANWDPRLWELADTESNIKANLTTLYGLPGLALMTDSVDSGWRLSLPNEAGEACLTWDSRGSRRHTEYDTLLRPVSVTEQGIDSESGTVERFTYADGSSQSAEHNHRGRITRHDDTAGSKQISGYALSGQVLSETRRFLKQLQTPSWPVELPLRDELLKEQAFTSTSLHAPIGELLEQTDAMGNRQRHQYNVAGQLKQNHLQLKGSREKTLLSAIRYNALGQVESETAGNGVISSFQYRPEDGRLIHLFAQRTTDSALQDIRYDYDPVGNIVSINDVALGTRHFNNQRIEPVSTYRYDSLYQLIEATGRESCSPANGSELPHYQPLPSDPNQMANYTQTYEYDSGGNLEKLMHVGAQQYSRAMMTAINSNRSLPLPDGGRDPDFANSFDPNGNLKHLQPGPDMNWNLRNQLQEITLATRPDSANDSEWYVYDGGGQRVRKVRTTQAKSVSHIAEVLYLPGLEIRTDSANDQVLHVINVQAGRINVRVLHWETVPPKDVENDQLRYGLSDHLGSSTLELDEQAKLLNQEGYYPFGGTAWFAARSETEGKYKTIRYSGKERDASGLYYYGFRYYVSWWMRWLNPDPAGAVDGLNLYRMVRNNPMTLVDENGLRPGDKMPPPVPPRPPAVPPRPPVRPSNDSMSSTQPYALASTIPQSVTEKKFESEALTAKEKVTRTRSNEYIHPHKKSHLTKTKSLEFINTIGTNNDFTPKRITVLDSYIQNPAPKNTVFSLSKRNEKYEFLSTHAAESPAPPKNIKGEIIFVIPYSNPFGVLSSIPEGAGNTELKPFEVHGHTSISNREDVLYAGKIYLDDDSKLQYWDNGSGHYKPDVSLHISNIPPALRELLPPDKFKPYDRSKPRSIDIARGYIF
ncbi:hypothetical protein BK659_06490 [Pseudomonas brassicacearum]|uniref:Toxin n=1 Tax=Pseudomonas brassicacearum TaxID=930166 RepID=A0A423HB41_9PSED|nr:RHS repeat-associated core domain-containing protein [Pseudomonas brassicacearum]RON10386.1 hypothetical protein BK659_06490 [Pseudomonas brassicacearum]